jgi:hypothetical protein
VIEAETSVVLNTFTEHTSRLHLINDRSTANCAYVQKETILKVMGVNRPKIRF